MYVFLLLLHFYYQKQNIISLNANYFVAIAVCGQFLVFSDAKNTFFNGAQVEMEYIVD